MRRRMWTRNRWMGGEEWDGWGSHCRAAHSVLPSHAMCTAFAYALPGWPKGSPAPTFVTGSMSLRYLQPTALRLDEEICVHARVQKLEGRKCTLSAWISQKGVRTTEADVVAIAVKPRATHSHAKL